MKSVRVHFRPEAAAPELMISPVMFTVPIDYTPESAEDCAALVDPISTYLHERCQLGTVSALRFSPPEKATAPGSCQDIVIDGGVRAGANRIRFTAEIHHPVCHCAACQDEDAYADQHQWL